MWTFKLQIDLAIQPPDFPTVESQREWQADTRSDFADLLRLVVNRIGRGESKGDVRDLNGEKCGTFEIA